MTDDLGHARLRDREHDEERLPDAMGLRVHRAISWLGRAAQEQADPDARFLFLWVAFNAAYAEEDSQPSDSQARDAFDRFFKKVVRLDADKRIYDAVWSTFSGPIRLLMNNRYVYRQFWLHQNGVPGYANWHSTFERSKGAFHTSLGKRHTEHILSLVFERLYVLRNQLMHGGATWNGSVNRAQVQDGAAILGTLMPVFIDIMMDNPDKDWGKPFYPVVGD